MVFFSGMRRVLQRLAPLAIALVFGLALWALHQLLRDYPYERLWLGVELLPLGRVLVALLLTFLGYLALTGYDALALRYVEKPLPYWKTGPASFITFVFSNTIGPAALTRGAMGSRLYSAWKLPAPTITRVIGFRGLTLWLGLLTVGGLGLLGAPGGVADGLSVPPIVVRSAAALMLGAVGCYLWWSRKARQPVVVGGWRIEPPPLALALAQVGVSALDWLSAALALYVLLPSGTGLEFPAFIGLFLLAQAGGLLSQVPGGLGVFESLILFLAPAEAPIAGLAGSLIAFRIIYYLLPLALAAIVLAALEALRHRGRLGRLTGALGRVVPGIAPYLLAGGTFVAGVILVFSGVTPTVGWRLELMRGLVPLPVLEASHFLGSLAGVGLLLLSHGLYRRLNAAWALAIVLLAVGIAASLLKGLDFEEATVSAAMLAALVPSRRVFYRRASLFDEWLTPGWIAAVLVVLATSIWLGFFAYRQVVYSNDLWWRFTFAGDAPRFLRATVGAVVLALVVATRWLLRPSRPEPELPTAEDLQRASAVINASAQPVGNLALLGDKSLLFSDTMSSFIMYGVQGRSWVAMGDPVGDDHEFAELSWRFREMSDRHGGWTVFYEVSRKWLPVYLDLGLTLVKLGEEAKVPLGPFSLEGSARSGLRRRKSAVERAGCCFEVVPAGEVLHLLPELRAVSDAWLAGKQVREKRFSLGSFTEGYVANFPAAIVRREGRMVAFANLWTCGSKDELMVDLMRFTSEAPADTMSYLFIQLMLWGKERGYGWFNLGMAPLSGLHGRTLAPLWNRLGSLVFRHGEHFYNFKGLRQYKERFDPVWEPRYLASPGALSLPFVLSHIAALISGSLIGIFAK
jgi:phosphatidylglycerol lysyltransferase